MKEAIISKQTAAFITTDPGTFKARALRWSKGFENLALLDNNGDQNNAYQSQEFMLAAGALNSLKVKYSEQQALQQLRDFIDRAKDWIFGFLAYDLKNELEDLNSANADHLGFPLLHFFQPLHLIKISGSEILIESWTENPKEIFSAIEEQNTFDSDLPKTGDIQIQSRINKADYLDRVEKIRQHIIEGDIYELNFCQEFYAENAKLDPWATFHHLNQISQAPFSAFYRCEDHFLLCASPERFLKKEARKLISQPIKGTSARGANPQEDQQFKLALAASAKDQAENVMIVDLVRNDLARSCQPGSVKVEELFGIYPFAQVHQMISTVVGKMRPEIHPLEAITSAFPMGSMTGAPKVMSMKLIEQYESSRRGLYSGAVGYFTPEGDFDFNVVIRSLLYNAQSKYLSFQVGGAIVYDSVPEQEYEECLLKAKGIMQVLSK